MASKPSNRKRTHASNAVLYTALVAGGVVLVNLIASRKFGHVDLTEAKIYTLSQASKDVVKKLPDYFNIKAFISSDLPPEMKSVAQYARDLLDEYRTYSDGKLRWEAVDPTQDKKLEEDASRCRVRKLQIQVMKADKFELGTHYLGLCFEYGGQSEAIPQVARPEGLEYQVSSLIKRMTQRKRKVAFTTGHGESDLGQGFSAIQRVLAEEFDTTTVNPSTAEIGEDVDALVVGGPKQPFDDKGRKEIDKFLMKGKGAIFLVDGMTMSTPRGQGMEQMQQAMPKIGQANETGLGELLSAYGFKIGQDFVLDPLNMAPGPIEAGGQLMIKSMPVFVGAPLAQGKDLSLTVGVKAAVFPFASSVDLTGPLAGGKPAQGKLWRLAATSPEAWKHSGFFFFSPEMKIEEGKDRGEVALAYAYQGPLKSAYAPAQAPAMSSPDSAATPAESKKPVRLVVVGDSDFASDEYVRLAQHPILTFYAGGAQLLVNAVSWALEDEALTPVRSKTVTPRPLTVKDERVAVIKAANIAGLPLAFCAFGVVRWRVRRARRAGQRI